MAEAARANGDTAKARDSYLQFLRVDPKNALAATAQARLAELDHPGDPVPPLPPPVPPPDTSAPPSTVSGTENLSAGPVATGPGPETPPMWKRLPFWAVVGGVVVGGAIVYAISRDDAGCGAGCSQFNFR
jgi:hypothetical protein